MRGGGVEGGSGFVGKQQRRVGGQRTGNADALLLAAGELLRVALAFVSQADEVQQLLHALGALLLADALQLQRVFNIAGRGARVHQVELLENHADIAANAAQLFLGHADDIGVIKQ